jgi:FtsP/CotA-like multicopper oxidase with cupredoxin domain
VVHSPDEDKLYKDQYDEEWVVYLGDYYHDSADDLLKRYLAPNVDNQEPIPDSGLLQGSNEFDCTKLTEKQRMRNNCSRAAHSIFPVSPGSTNRFRIINGGAFSEFDFSIDNHKMVVIEADGVNTEALGVDVLRIANAQRYSVLVNMTNKEHEGVWMRASMNKACYDGENKNLDTDLKAVIAYPKMMQKLLSNKGRLIEKPSSRKYAELNKPTVCSDLNSSMLVPQIRDKPPERTKFIRLDADFVVGPDNTSLGYFNQTSNKNSIKPSLFQVYEILEDEHARKKILSVDSSTPQWADGKMVITFREPEVVDLLVNNKDDG